MHRRATNVERSKRSASRSTVGCAPFAHRARSVRKLKFGNWQGHLLASTHDMEARTYEPRTMARSNAPVPKQRLIAARKRKCQLLCEVAHPPLPREGRTGCSSGEFLPTRLRLISGPNDCPQESALRDGGNHRGAPRHPNLTRRLKWRGPHSARIQSRDRRFGKSRLCLAAENPAGVCFSSTSVGTPRTGCAPDRLRPRKQDLRGRLSWLQIKSLG
jgi:hypothetical protein